MDQISERLEELFDSWAKKDRHKKNIKKNLLFVKDGVLNEELWCASENKNRILFVLKEAYMSKGKEYDDLRELVRKRWKAIKFWKNMAMLAYLLQKTTSDTIPDYIEQENKKTEEVLWEALSYTAVMNAKKSGGRATSNPACLRKYVREDEEEILREIEIVKPNVIFFGGTYELMYCDGENIRFKDEIDEKSHVLIKDRIYLLKNGQDRTIIINWWHPACRYDFYIYYQALAISYSKALRKLPALLS